jgi:hypothetical protein
VSDPTQSTQPDVGTGAISGTVRERLAPLLVLFGALFAVSAPLAFFVMGARELDDRGRSLASQAAETLARYAEEQPVLWRYDSLKLVEHLRYFETQADVVRIDVVDAHGVPIDARSYEVPTESLAWTSAPLEVSTASPRTVSSSTTFTSNGATSVPPFVARMAPAWHASKTPTRTVAWVSRKR